MRDRQLGQPGEHRRLREIQLRSGAPSWRVPQAFVRPRRFVADASHERCTPVVVPRNKADAALPHAQRRHFCRKPDWIGLNVLWSACRWMSHHAILNDVSTNWQRLPREKKKYCGIHRPILHRIRGKRWEKLRANLCKALSMLVRGESEQCGAPLWHHSAADSLRKTYNR